MYNLQFADAHRTFLEWEKSHPSDPIGPASNAAAYLFSEFDRLHVLQSEFFVAGQLVPAATQAATGPGGPSGLR